MLQWLNDGKNYGIKIIKVKERGGANLSVQDIENAIQKIIVKKHNETVTLFMVRGEYNAVKQFIEDCDKRMREQCACIKDC